MEWNELATPANPKWLPRFFFSIFICFFKYETIETYARAFLSVIILDVGTV